MAKSLKKRGLQNKPKSRKSISKEEQRIESNNQILKKLSQIEK
jgi:hypothetical protein